jgi:hypothetical protein
MTRYKIRIRSHVGLGKFTNRDFFSIAGISVVICVSLSILVLCLIIFYIQSMQFQTMPHNCKNSPFH